MNRLGLIICTIVIAACAAKKQKLPEPTETSPQTQEERSKEASFETLADQTKQAFKEYQTERASLTVQNPEDEKTMEQLDFVAETISKQPSADIAFKLQSPFIDQVAEELEGQQAPVRTENLGLVQTPLSTAGTLVGIGMMGIGIILAFQKFFSVQAKISNEEVTGRILYYSQSGAGQGYYYVLGDKNTKLYAQRPGTGKATTFVAIVRGEKKPVLVTTEGHPYVWDESLAALPGYQSVGGQRYVKIDEKGVAKIFDVQVGAKEMMPVRVRLDGHPYVSDAEVTTFDRYVYFDKEGRPTMVDFDKKPVLLAWGGRGQAMVFKGTDNFEYVQIDDKGIAQTLKLGTEPVLIKPASGSLYVRQGEYEALVKIGDKGPQLYQHEGKQVYVRSTLGGENLHTLDTAGKMEDFRQQVPESIKAPKTPTVDASGPVTKPRGMASRLLGPAALIAAGVLTIVASQAAGSMGLVEGEHPVAKLVRKLDEIGETRKELLAGETET